MEASEKLTQEEYDFLINIMNHYHEKGKEKVNEIKSIEPILKTIAGEEYEKAVKDIEKFERELNLAGSIVTKLSVYKIEKFRQLRLIIYKALNK
jgi:polyphosphate kinase 2 (PPK2 family)